MAIQNHREVKFAETLAHLIEARGYSGARKLVCRAVEVSQSALSQYLNGSSAPSFDKLIALADFFEVSLDYLVFGTHDVEARSIDYGPIVRYIDMSLSDLRRRSDTHLWAFSKIAQELSKRISDAAQQVAENNIVRPGVITDEDTLALEEHSLDTAIISMNLQYDIIESEGERSIPGRFLTVVANNLSLGRQYRFILPNGVQNWKPLVRDYLSLLQKYCHNDQVVLNHCRFKCTDSPITNGCGIYHLDPELLIKHPILHENVYSFMSPDRWIGYTIPPSSLVQGDMLMDLTHLINAKESFEKLWETGIPI